MFSEGIFARYSSLGFTLDIVVSVGFVYFPPGGVSESHQKDLNEALNEGVPQNFLIAREFLPALKSREGSTYTIVSGGLAFFCPQANFWAATLKNAALNALTLGLAADTKNDKTRVNNLCIFVPVTEIDGNGKNQFGMEGPETRIIGRAFVAVVQGSKRGEVIQFKAATESEIEAAVAELAK
jgi:NAD(P)-dependent dehydrogenase (short-subunit alcohol dehydrogenase family)